ncbi:hypothetical protein FANTH_2463 [Fusarium anthophilum]|uniref:Uncharacterized protein n=1 Tax=Fusarium anthophilum TaxID=48485 RepID=A0A8H4ZTL9_9HYPO|nr:hypothetical protein FANTH_2463 [Fusarium anthophilum]
MPCCDSQTHTETTKPSMLFGRAQTLCGGPGCRVTLENITQMFPALKVLPRPEPAEGSSEDHKHWLEESEKWRSLRCKCGRGYFCREHGDWISGNEVGAGKAVTGDQQQPGSCPSYHYDDSERETYVGQRDGGQMATV